MTADADRVLEDLGRVAGLVQDHIANLVTEQMDRWDDRGGDPSVVAALQTYRDMALSPGKRLRPAFAYWAYEGLGGDPDDPAILDAAVAVELLHTFALIHDDVMDRAETRRGKRTIHETYAAHHRTDDLRGDADHYGNSIAILMGDLAFAHAALLMTRVPGECAAIFFSMCADLMVGQYLDIDAAAIGPRPGREVADQITELKTARYTVEGPLLLGAAARGRADELRPHIEAYGRPLGQAFQLRDDLLGVFGDPLRTGKPVGDDLAQGKVTRLLEVGIARVGPEHHALLTRLGSPAMQPDDPELARDLLVSSGALAEIEASIASLEAEAVAAADRSPFSTEIRAVLGAAAHLIANRDR